MEVTRELVLPATREEVWQALTEPERLEEWLANDVELDLELGEGIFRWDDGETRRAIVELVEPGRRLGLRWWDEESPDAETNVLIELEDDDPVGTRLVVTESAPDAVSAEWTVALELHAHFGRSPVST